MDQTVVETCFFSELARRDACVADADEQPLGGIEKSLFGFLARRRDPDPLALRGFDG
jgi:hypothetical protein